MLCGGALTATEARVKLAIRLRFDIGALVGRDLGGGSGIEYKPQGQQCF